MTRALEDVRVLEVGMFVQGPQAAALLCDMGAGVIKVELPGVGDPGRSVTLSPDDDRSAIYAACNRGKRSLTLDLHHPEGVAIFKRLVRNADVVISNFHPGTMEAWGLGYEALRAENPGIVYATGSTFGPLGPDAEREGADLAGQCAGGLIRTTGSDGDPPTPVGAFVADHIGSLNLVSGVLAALLHRQRSGVGQQVDVSLVGGQIWAQATEYTHYLLKGELPGRSNLGHPLVRAVYRIFATRDGWIGIIGVPPQDMDAFLVAIDLPDLVLDERLQQPALAPDVLAWFGRKLEEVFVTRTTAGWCDVLGAAGIRHAPVRTYVEALEDPNNWANGYFAEVAGARGATQRVVGSPIHMSETPLHPGAVAPELGSDTVEILSELGLTDPEIEALREAGTV